MTTQDIHLLTNHIPAYGLIFGLLLWIVGLVHRNDGFVRFGQIVLVLTAILAIPAFQSGHPAHELIEDLPGSSHAAIREHRQAAKPAYYMLLGLGVLSLLLYVQLKWVALNTRIVQWVVVGFGLVILVAMLRVNHLGGMIRRPELRGEVALPTEAEIEAREQKHREERARKAKEAEEKKSGEQEEKH